MTSATLERICARPGCGAEVTGRADKRFCSDACRAALSRCNRTEPNRTHVTGSGLATVTPIGTTPAMTWDPVRGHRSAYRTAGPPEPCPDCGDVLISSPGGTRRFCLACNVRVIPVTVAAPYQRDQDAPQRQVVSQRERDLGDLVLAAAQDQLLRRVRRSLPPGSAVAEQLASKIRAASSAHRLRELGELLAEVLGTDAAGGGEEEIAGDDVVEGDIVEDEVIPTAGGIPAAPRPTVLSRWGTVRALPPGPPQPQQVTTPADALAVLGLTVPLASPAGGCQIAEAGLRCSAETRFSIEVNGSLVWLCTRHNYAVNKILKAARSA